MFLRLIFVFLLSLITVQSLEKFFLKECGVERGCWAFPPNCSDENCDGLVRWFYNTTNLLLEIQSTDIELFETGRFIAVGLSGDSQMGNDTVVECVFDENGIGAAYISYNERTNNFQLLNASQEMIVERASGLVDGQMICLINLNFSSKKRVEEQESRLIHNIDNGEWTLLFAKGLAAPETGEKIMHSLNAGKLFPWSTSEKIMFCKDCTDKHKIVTGMRQKIE